MSGDIKPGDRVVILQNIRPSGADVRATVLDVDGAYITVRPDDARCERDINELYPNELGRVLPRSCSCGEC